MDTRKGIGKVRRLPEKTKRRVRWMLEFVQKTQKTTPKHSESHAQSSQREGEANADARQWFRQWFVASQAMVRQRPRCPRWPRQAAVAVCHSLRPHCNKRRALTTLQLMLTSACNAIIQVDSETLAAILICRLQIEDCRLRIVDKGL